MKEIDTLESFFNFNLKNDICKFSIEVSKSNVDVISFYIKAEKENGQKQKYKVFGNRLIFIEENEYA